MTVRIRCLGNLVGSPLTLSFQSTSKLRPPLRTCVLPDCLVFPCSLLWGCCSHTASWSLWPGKAVMLQGLGWQEWLSSKWSAQRNRVSKAENRSRMESSRSLACSWHIPKVPSTAEKVSQNSWDCQCLAETWERIAEFKDLGRCGCEIRVQICWQ